MTVPLCPLISRGPDATSCARALVASNVNKKMGNALERALGDTRPII
jgi:hypothetical protein